MAYTFALLFVLLVGGVWLARDIIRESRIGDGLFAWPYLSSVATIAALSGVGITAASHWFVAWVRTLLS